jgi:hypothetical protein
VEADPGQVGQPGDPLGTTTAGRVRSWAPTRCWRPGPTPVRCCTPGCARARPTPPAASPGSWTSWRRADRAGRLGVLVSQAHPAAARPPGALLDHGPPDQRGPRRHRRHSRSGLGPDRLPTRSGRAGRRDSLSERPADRASRPHDRPPRWVGERLPGPWPPAMPSRGAGPAPPGPSVIPSLVRRARLPGRPGIGGVAA